MSRHKKKKRRIMQNDKLMNIIIKIPKGTYKLKLDAEFVDDTVHGKASMTVNKEDIEAYRQDFLDNVEDGDDFDGVFVITEKGLQTIAY